MLKSIALLFGAGLLFFFVVGNILDAVLHRIALALFGDPLVTLEYDSRRRFVLNIVRPVCLTLVIFGGGLATAGLLGVSTLGAIFSGLWFFFLTQVACLAGRQNVLRLL